VTAAVLPHRYAMAPVGQLHPHPENANTADVAAITESIEGVGFWGVVLVHEATGNILAGEHRWRAAQAAGIPELPVIVIDCDDDTARDILLGDNE
jgi:ParB-like chromosome segregation protein Spo0J